MRLVGRQAEMAAIHRAIERAARGMGGALLVSGEAGMGKTALVAAALDAPPSPIAAVWAAASEGGGPPTLWPWIQVLRRMGAPAALLERVEGGGALPEPVPEADGRRFRLFDDVCEHVISAVPGRVRVLVIDDLQWADDSSIELLAALARRLHDRSTVIVAVYRPEELDRHAARDLLRSGEEVELAGLELDEVGELMAALGTELTRDKLQEVWRRTDGNPLFVREMARLVRASGDPGDSLPAGITELLERRLARLPQPVVSLLGAAAVCSPGADAALIADVEGVGPDVALDAIDHATRSGVLQEQGADSFAFSHDLFRAALLAGIGPQRRRALHAAAARVLSKRFAEGRDVAPSVIAEHYLAALPKGSAADAARFATLAAERSMAQYGFDDAAGWYRRAVEAVELSVPVDRARRVELLIRHADASRRAGVTDDARRSLVRAADLCRRGELERLLPGVALGMALLGGVSSSGDTSIRLLLGEALKHVDPDDDATRARLLASLARDHYHQGGGGTEPIVLAEQAVAAAQKAASPGALWCSLAALHDGNWQPGSASARLRVAQQMVRLAERHGDLDGQVEAHLLRYGALFELGDPDAVPAFQRYAQLAGLSREPHHGYVVTSRWAMQALASGRYADADHLISAAAATARRIGEADGPVVELNQRWEMYSDLGRRAELLETLEVFSAFSAHPGIWLCLAMARWADGDRPGAEGAFARCLEADLAAVEPAYGRPWVAALLVEAAIMLGRFDEVVGARASLEAAGPAAIVVGAAAVFHGAAQHHLGVLHAALGERDEAIAHLRRGEQLHHQMGAEPWLVRSRLALADVVDDPDGPGLRASAHELAGGLGMTIIDSSIRGSVASREPVAVGSMSREGDVWTLAFEGRSCRLKHSKGLEDLAVLLARPAEGVAAADLYGGDSGGPGAAPVLDDAARRAYASRLRELELAAVDADVRGDVAASIAATNETEAILDQLRAATGLGGRHRRLGDPAERARKAVSGRLRDAIRHIAAVHPPLGAHLSASVTTGAWCAYRPPEPPAGSGSRPGLDPRAIRSPDGPQAGRWLIRTSP